MQEHQPYFSHANLQDCIMDAWDAVENSPEYPIQDTVFDDFFDLSDLDTLPVEHEISVEASDDDATLYSIFYENTSVIKNSFDRSEEYLCIDPNCEIAEVSDSGFIILEDRCNDTECNDIYLKLNDGRTIKTTREALDVLSQQPETIQNTVVHFDAARLSRELEKVGLNVQETAMLYSQGAYQTAHVESGCCTPTSSSQTLFKHPSPSVTTSIGGGGGGSVSVSSLHQSEDHSTHKHCSCGGHFEEGKCEKCGKSAEQAA